VTIEQAKHAGAFPSGRGFWVEIDGERRGIPASVVADDSELGIDDPIGTVGDLAVASWFAERELDDGPEGSGLVLKRPPRVRITPPASGLSDGQLKRIEARARSLGEVVDEDLLYVDGALVGVLEDGEQFAVALMMNRTDVLALVTEVRLLRAWIDGVVRRSGR
jgi:hypothetical protein